MLDTYKMLDPKGFGGLFDSDYMIEKTKNDLLSSVHIDMSIAEFIDKIRLPEKRRISMNKFIPELIHINHPEIPIKDSKLLTLRDLEGIDKFYTRSYGFGPRVTNSFLTPLFLCGAKMGTHHTLRVIGNIPERTKLEAEKQDRVVNDVFGKRLYTVLDNASKALAASAYQQDKPFTMEQRTAIERYVRITRLLGMDDKESLPMLIDVSEIRKKNIPGKWIDNVTGKLKELYGIKQPDPVIRPVSESQEIKPKSKVKLRSDISEVEARRAEYAAKDLIRRSVSYSFRNFSAQDEMILKDYKRCFTPSSPLSEIFRRLYDSVISEKAVAVAPERWKTDVWDRLNDLVEGGRARDYQLKF